MSRHPVIRIAFVVVTLVAAVGCSGGGDSVLFSDDFSGPFPGANWVGDGVVTTTAGVPAPALYLAPTPPIVTGTVQMTNPVDAGGGLTLRFAAAVPAGSQGRVFLLDAQAGGSPLGDVTFRASGEIAYVIAGAPGAIQTVTADGAFHTYELRFRDGGTSTWTRDGAVQLQVTGVNDATLAKILADTSVDAGFFLDEIEIRSP